MEEDLSESLLQWAQTFEVDLPVDSVQVLSDGVALSRILNQIAPSFFDEQWLSRIKAEDVLNWRIKVSNLKKILKGVQDYYSDEIGLNFNDFQMPNLQAVAEQDDAVELGKLLQLILGCAINCENKQFYIQKIMSMEESVQHGVMTAIQNLMDKEDASHTKRRSSTSDTSLSAQLRDLTQELRSVSQARDELVSRCHELDSQVVALQDEKTSLQAENDKLHEKLNHSSDGLDDSLTSSGRRLMQLQQQVEKLKDDTYRLEAARDDYKVKYEQSCRELLDAKLKADELSKLADEARALKDEVDVLRNFEDRAIKHEATIEMYKKRLEEMADLKRQVKALEEKNAAYVQTSVDLEEESKKTGSLKSQIEMFKRQVQELQATVSAETQRADKCAFESRRSQEQLQSLQKEKERLVAERDALREANEELTCNSSMAHGRGSSLLTGSGDVGENLLSDIDSFVMASLPADVREKIIRLQHENSLLKRSRSESGSSGGGEEGEGMLRSLLDTAQARSKELEAEKRAANQKILELEAALDDLNRSTAQERGDSSSVVADLKQKLGVLTQRLAGAEAEVAKKKEYIDGVDTRVLELQAALREKEARLQAREDEMRVHEQAHAMHVEKAQSISAAAEAAAAAAGAGGEVEQLRGQLAEKERLVMQIQREHERAARTREQEERLMVSAWYNLSMQMEHRAVRDRLSQVGGGPANQGQSFLARQRQVHSRLPQQPSSVSSSSR